MIASRGKRVSFLWEGETPVGSPHSNGVTSHPSVYGRQKKQKKIRLSGLLNSVVEREVSRYGWIWKEFKVNMVNVVSMINTVKYIVQ